MVALVQHRDDHRDPGHLWRSRVTAYYSGPIVARRFHSLILCYHGVSDAWEHSLAVRPRALERQVRSLIRRGYRPVSADDAVEGGSRRFHVTFDDAYTNVASGLAILEALDVPATVFACASYADDGRALDIPELAAAVAVFGNHMATMTWDELGDLAERGVEIGSHTLTHPHLPRLSDAELERELDESRRRFEDVLGRPCRYLAYPFGDDDERVYRAAERAGYAAAFSLRGSADKTDRYALPRVDLYRRDGLIRTTLKTSFVRSPAVAALTRLRAVTGRT
jgi:peptidoglycan/xylan/chitin deacetylase (PgdA/CDA1 family)